MTQDDLLQAVKDHGGIMAAARALGMAKSTLQGRLKGAQARYEEADPSTPISRADELESELRALRNQLAAFKREALDEEFVKRSILKMAEAHVEAPKWLISNRATKKSPGVPTLFASDLHWGEVVDPSQIGGVNEYDMAIANRRLRRMVEVTIDLLNNHMVNPEYPGIVFALGGDLVSGGIHEELMATDEREIMPVVLDLFGALAWCITTLADHFGRVFVPCVSGNHGRNTHKIRAKGRNYTSFDWLIYCFLAKRFEGDKRVSFLIPNGPDALYKVYNTRYLLTHGDQFRGGDGMIGALGPIIRGDHKKRGRQAQIGGDYEVMLLGHWHQLIQLQRLIVNGSLKGYDEYAYSNNFGYEPPRQALWVTHPSHGITFSMPVNVDEPRKIEQSSWVSWAA
jgi:hypothetical protein